MPMTFHSIKQQYPTGTVVNLCVQKILQEKGLIIFYEGEYSALLHISEIANDKRLSRKLFSVVRVDDKIDVVIIGFDDKKRTILCSFKSLRNNLKGALSSDECRRLIEEEASDRVNQKEKRLQQDRNTLDRALGDLQKTDLTFLYELIQNAVDNPSIDYENKVRVKFEITNNYLLLKHDGAVITESNFGAITGIFNSDGEKEKDKSKIGYKGIGFKSVFRYSQNVYIRSGNFSFSFNKEQTGGDKAWEVIPIFEREIDKIDKIQQFDFFNASVAFAFEMTNDTIKNNVIEYLTQLSNNPYLLIFLDNLTELKITLPESKYFTTKETSIQNDKALIKITNNNDKEETWVSFSKKYEIIDKNIEKELLDENNRAIPNKFRYFRTPNIQILLPLDDHTDLVNLFTYLPLSNTQYKLPFIINADFIPNLSRTDIIDDIEYNYKIAEFAADTLVYFSQSLARKKQYKYLLQTLPQFDNIQKNRFLQTLKDTYFNLCATIPIFPTQNDSELCLFSELLLDETGIFTLLQDEIVTLTDIDKKLICNEIDEKGLQKVKALMREHKQGVIYTFTNLKNDLQTELFQIWLKIPANNFKIIQFFAQKENLKSLIASEKIVLAQSGNLLEAGALYNSVPKEIAFMKTEQINSELLELLTEKDITISLKAFEPVSFYNEKILNDAPNINTILTSDNNLLNFWRFIYDNWNLFKVDTPIKNSLKQFRVLCKKDSETTLYLPIITRAYLSTEFNPGNEIESIVRSLSLPEPVYYIVPDYIDEKRTINTWETIFKAAHAITDLQQVIEKVIEKLPENNR